MTTPDRAAVATHDGPDGSPDATGTAPLRGAVPVRGRLAGVAAYAFTDRSDGTMGEVGSSAADDHLANRAALAAALGGDRISWMRQVHGGDVVQVDPATPGVVGAEPPACDGIVVSTPGGGAGVLAADCVPVLMAAPGRRPAVGAAHAGRGGVLAAVAPTTALAVARAAGVHGDQVEVVIGPAIGPCCYEVPPAMAADVEAAVPGTRSTTTWGTPSVDLVAGVVRQLHAAGVRRIARAGGCTRCEATWFSHRATGDAEGRPAGRQAGVAVLDAGAGTSGASS